MCISICFDIYSMTVFIWEDNSRHTNNSKRGIEWSLFGASQHFAASNDVITEELDITRM